MLVQGSEEDTVGLDGVTNAFKNKEERCAGFSRDAYPGCIRPVYGIAGKALTMSVTVAACPLSTTFHFVGSPVRARRPRAGANLHMMLSVLNCNDALVLVDLGRYTVSESKGAKR